MSSSGRDAAAYTPRLRGEISRLQEHFLDLFATTGVTSVVEVANGFDEEDFIQVFDSDLSEVARGLWQRCEAHCDRAARGVGQFGLLRPTRAPATGPSAVVRPSASVGPYTPAPPAKARPLARQGEGTRFLSVASRSRSFTRGFPTRRFPRVFPRVFPQGVP